MAASHQFHALEDGNNTCFNCCYCSKRQRCVSCWVLWSPIILLIAIVIVLVVNASLVSDRFERLELDPSPIFINASEEVVLARARRLGGAIKIKSISYNPGEQETDEFVKLVKYINDTYTNIRSSKFIKRHEINHLSIIYLSLIHI